MHGKKLITEKNASQSRAAFTLVELAIVLGIASIVIAGIWVAAGSVWRNYKIERTTKQLTDVVTNVRAFYGPNALFASAAYAGDVTALADAQHLIPIEMRAFPKAACPPCGPVNHGINSDAAGSFQLWKISGTIAQLRLLFLSPEECARLLMQFPVLMPEIGITFIGANGAGTNVDAYKVDQPGDAAGLLPLSLATATSWCSATANTVLINFKLRN